jgi:hypothetical protein
LDGKVDEDEPLLLGGEESHLKPEDRGGVEVLLVLPALVVHKVKVKNLPVVLQRRVGRLKIHPQVVIVDFSSTARTPVHRKTHLK